MSSLKSMDAEHDFVAILDCLPALDRIRMGLSDDVRRLIEKRGHEQRIVKCSGRGDLEDALRSIAVSAMDGRSILHIIGHGNDERLGAGCAKEFVPGGI